jgi:hypothetical protein
MYLWSCARAIAVLVFCFFSDQICLGIAKRKPAWTLGIDQSNLEQTNLIELAVVERSDLDNTRLMGTATKNQQSSCKIRTSTRTNLKAAQVRTNRRSRNQPKILAVINPLI